MKKEKKNKAAPGTPSRLSVMLGTDKFHNTTTLMCIIIGIAWLLLYIVCAACRDAMISKTVTDLAQKGTEEYTLVISSPLFTVLKLLLWLLPVFSVLWAISTVRAEKKKKLLCEKKLLITALVSIAVASFTAVIDLAKLHIIFGE